jgi:hypothetical protein
MYLMKWNMGRIIAPSILNADPKHVIGQLHDPAALHPGIEAGFDTEQISGHLDKIYLFLVPGIKPRFPLRHRSTYVSVHNGGRGVQGVTIVQHNNMARSYNYCCSLKAISIT